MSALLIFKVNKLVSNVPKKGLDTVSLNCESYFPIHTFTTGDLSCLIYTPHSGVQPGTLHTTPSFDAHPPHSDSVLQEGSSQFLTVRTGRQTMMSYSQKYPFGCTNPSKHSEQLRKCYKPFTCQITNRGFIGWMVEIRAPCSMPLIASFWKSAFLCHWHREGN